MMNRCTLKEVQISEWYKEVQWTESCHLSYFSHAINFERLGTPNTGIPAKLITPNLGGGGTPYSRLYSRIPPRGSFQLPQRDKVIQVWQLKISKKDAATLLLMKGLPLLSKSERCLPVEIQIFLSFPAGPNIFLDHSHVWKPGVKWAQRDYHYIFQLDTKLQLFETMKGPFVSVPYVLHWPDILEVIFCSFCVNLT